METLRKPITLAALAVVLAGSGYVALDRIADGGAGQGASIVDGRADTLVATHAVPDYGSPKPLR